MSVIKHDKKKILITGGAGFIGSAMIRYLIKNTKNRVHNIDALTYSGNLNSLSEVSSSSRYQFSNINILDYSSILRILEEYKPEIIINFAAESHVDKSIDAPSVFFETNVMGTLNLLKAVLNFYKKNYTDTSSSFKFHHISTDEVFGDIHPDDEPVNETRSYNPSSPYAASKASSDHIVRAFHRTYNLPITISNCSNNYGPFHFPEKLIPHIIISCLQVKQLPIYGDGMQIRDWLHVDDHVEAIMKIIQDGKIGETYNIGGDNEKTNLYVVNRICEILDEKILEKPEKIDSFKDLIYFSDDRPGHDKRYAINSKKIQNDLSWKPLVDFDQGLINTIDWYMTNTDWWENILSGDYILKRQGNTKS